MITWLAFVLVGLTDWAWGPSIAGYESQPAQLGLGGAAEIAASVAIGMVALVLLPVVLRALALGDAALARALLTNENASLRARGDKLTAQRAQVGAEEASTLRKVERDLHDGPQQRLIRLQMDLQGAQRRIDSDPAAARVLMGEALEQSNQALAELRALSRGIAPPILADRGFVAAVDGLAARATVPVRVHSDLPAGERLPEAAENAAYFVVSEALANIAKHAEASAVAVTITATADALVLQIDDDGVGGAHPGKGHGLAGLIDRLAGVDGQLHVDSPVGGPTRIQATIDLAGEPSPTRLA
ncbi:sensor histidine kinase [Tomitella biformata]|uniref:sensor histidine kinase n=1 Tax=Tomitella biformata TaxID=630403 RepID=UPI000466C553|nr:histidine kinase [Tomitella biformata]